MRDNIETERRPRISKVTIGIGIFFLTMIVRMSRMRKLPTFDLSSGSLLDDASSFATEFVFGETVEKANTISMNTEGTEIAGGVDLEEEIVDRRLTLEELLFQNGKSLSGCPESTVMMQSEPRETSKTSLIPMIIHQGYPSHCLSNNLAENAQRWSNLTDYGYYFHDLASMRRLIAQDWPEFGHMESVAECVRNYEGIYDLWRALVLWEFGGIVTELNVVPTFTERPFEDSTDGVMELARDRWPSGDFVAFAPKHPVAYYAVQQFLNTIAGKRNMLEWNSPGRDEWKGGFLWHWHDMGRDRVPRRAFSAETYVGKHGRNVTCKDANRVTEPNEKLGDLWRTRYYPHENFEGIDFNVTCMHFTYDFQIGYPPKALSKERRRR